MLLFYLIFLAPSCVRVCVSVCIASVGKCFCAIMLCMQRLDIFGTQFLLRYLTDLHKLGIFAKYA